VQLAIIVLITIFLFYVTALICEDYFVPSIDLLAKKLKMPSDVAGATLLASGSSAPEFFASIIAVFGLAGASSDVGSGTIVGSAIFNVLVIIGASAMFKSVVLQWKPVIRDLGFYVLTILLLFWFFYDGKVSLIEAVVFLLMYAIYIFATMNWKKWFHYEDTSIIETYEQGNRRSNVITKVTEKAVSWVIPDVEKKPHLYLATFGISIAMIGLTSYLLVDQLVRAADILNVNQTFLALTVLAAGTSIPDLVSSIIVARQGRGDMAVSNAIGSNVFNILFGLGFPWALYIIFKGGTVAVDNENLNASLILLLATVIAIIFLLVIRNWKIGHRSGLILILLYVAYIGYVISTI
jgi:K+-dependent Na+/Ca+ exchanger-like protein